METAVWGQFVSERHKPIFFQLEFEYGATKGVRKVRVEYAGAFYYVINRGNYRSWIFETKGAWKSFLKRLTEVCQARMWLSIQNVSSADAVGLNAAHNLLSAHVFPETVQVDPFISAGGTKAAQPLSRIFKNPGVSTRRPPFQIR